MTNENEQANPNQQPADQSFAPQDDAQDNAGEFSAVSAPQEQDLAPRDATIQQPPRHGWGYTFSALAGVALGAVLTQSYSAPTQQAQTGAITQDAYQLIQQENQDLTDRNGRQTEIISDLQQQLETSGSTINRLQDRLSQLSRAGSTNTGAGDLQRKLDTVLATSDSLQEENRTLRSSNTKLTQKAGLAQDKYNALQDDIERTLQLDTAQEYDLPAKVRELQQDLSDTTTDLNKAILFFGEYKNATTDEQRQHIWDQYFPSDASDEQGYNFQKQMREFAMAFNVQLTGLQEEPLLAQAGQPAQPGTGSGTTPQGRRGRRNLGQALQQAGQPAQLGPGTGPNPGSTGGPAPGTGTSGPNTAGPQPGPGTTGGPAPGTGTGAATPSWLDKAEQDILTYIKEQHDSAPSSAIFARYEQPGQPLHNASLKDRYVVQLQEDINATGANGMNIGKALWTGENLRMADGTVIQNGRRGLAESLWTGAKYVGSAFTAGHWVPAEEQGNKPQGFWGHTGYVFVGLYKGIVQEIVGGTLSSTSHAAENTVRTGTAIVQLPLDTLLGAVPGVRHVPDVLTYTVNVAASTAADAIPGGDGSRRVMRSGSFRKAQGFKGKLAELPIVKNAFNSSTYDSNPDNTTQVNNGDTFGNYSAVNDSGTNTVTRRVVETISTGVGLDQFLNIIEGSKTGDGAAPTPRPTGKGIGGGYTGGDEF